MSSAQLAKLLLGASLLATVAISLRAPAPRRHPGTTELRLLVGSTLALYAVGAAAALSGHGVLTGIVLACGIAASALGAWLSRGSAGEGPSDRAEPEPGPEAPPPPPDPFGPLDWDELLSGMPAREAPREPAGVA